jgi:2-polyprenyl-3-methyl-5-hydroxy-6-metoxy-1,4-benzoquinol methylase
MFRDRLYEAYASEHTGRSGAKAVGIAYRRDIRPALPALHSGTVLDIGCGQGELVRLLLAEGYDAVGVDLSPEQVTLAHQAGLDQILQGDYRDFLAARRGQLAAVTATDLLEPVVSAIGNVAFPRLAAPGTDGTNS